MQNLLIGGNGNCLRGIDHPFDIGALDLSIPNCHNPMGIHTPNMTASYARIDRMNLAAGHHLRFGDSMLYRLNGRLYVYDCAFL